MYDATSFELELLRERKALEEASTQLGRFIESELTEAKVFTHGVLTRVKDVASATRKLRKKRYVQPWYEMTDLVGVRVFTYFRPDSLLVEDVLRRHFEIDEENSSNKFEELEFNTFGYTSRHLICRTSDKTHDIRLRSSRLKDLRFEVQIRTLLEHAWAEIEHELVYKAGTKPSKATRRRFAASAASLEIIEREFDALRLAEFRLIGEREAVVEQRLDAQLDRGWMVAALRVVYPDRPGWNPKPTENVFFHGIELEILEHLHHEGCTTLESFMAALKSDHVTKMVTSYAQARAIEPVDVTHLPIALFAAGVASDGELPDSLTRLLDRDAKAIMAIDLSQRSESIEPMKASGSRARDRSVKK